jgi:glycosyltransferase involved in cell wall biosynthesis
MNDLPKVSIVLNNYNYEPYLAEAVDSALAQTYSNCEVIVVDDGSTDGSKEILETYGDRIQLIAKANGGQASAFNVGIEAAKGEYILLLDSDDTLEPNALERAVEVMDPQAVRLLHGLSIIDKDGSKTGTYHAGVQEEFLGTMGESILQSIGALATPTSGNFFRASALKACVPIPLQEFRICADAYLFLKVAEFGKVQKTLDQLARYRVHGANNFFHTASRFGMDDTSLARLVENLLKVWSMLEHYLLQNEPTMAKEVRNTSFKLSALELVSDAKVRNLEVVGLDAWTSTRLIGHAYSCLWNRGGGARTLGRELYGFFTIIVNELFPSSIARGLQRFIESRRASSAA